MIAPEINFKGYPTAETLRTIKAWRPGPEDGYGPLIEFIRPIFEQYGRITRSGGVVEIATGGWSGCEDVVVALTDNLAFWSKCWLAVERGGVYRFVIDDDFSDKSRRWRLVTKNDSMQLVLSGRDDGGVKIEIAREYASNLFLEYTSMCLTKEQARQIGGFLSAHNILG
jgi:hypothetical protein